MAKDDIAAQHTVCNPDRTSFALTETTAKLPAVQGALPDSLSKFKLQRRSCIDGLQIVNSQSAFRHLGGGKLPR